MNRFLHECMDRIVSDSIRAVQPDAAVRRALEGKAFPGRVVLVAAGKAAWRMAKTAYDVLGSRIEQGVVVTKYGHVAEPIPNCTCFEAGHPVPDENSFIGTKAALDLTADLTAEDTVVFLLSGGGSALFESPLIPAEELQHITNQLLACGADIVQINTIRKRLSGVKGGRFALHCAPAQVFSVVLSDILGDPLDMIASGPAYPDGSTCAQAMEIARKYQLELSDKTWKLLEQETPKELFNVSTRITGSVRQLCEAAARSCQSLGFTPMILSDHLDCEARTAGRELSKAALEQRGKKLALIAGGETVVKLTGSGKGGRNQELALAAAEMLRGKNNICCFSLGSDGTDGPTDAAGGYVDGDTYDALLEQGIEIDDVLRRNDSYHALKAVDGLIITGPTGTNVNDVAVVLIDE